MHKNNKFQSEGLDLIEYMVFLYLSYNFSNYSDSPSRYFLNLSIDSFNLRKI